MEHITQFLEDTFVQGKMPTLTGAPSWWRGEFKAAVHKHVAFVKDPVHAVCLGMCGAPVVGGVSIGRPPCIETLPDLLLGIIDESGEFKWAGGGYGEIVSLHSPKQANFVAGWPVFFTFGKHDGVRRRLIVSKKHSIDLSERRKKKTAIQFWGRSKKEFVEMTWAPHRLAWCLDWEESKALLFG